MKLYNTLTRKKEEFVPIKKGHVGIYSCGPTVYWNQHIGHMYAYTQWDCLARAFRYLGYKVKWVMNITDVGHMTSDEDAGEDKMEKGAQREGITVWQIADKYIAQFKESMKALNIQKPDVLCRATEHIKEQIELIKKIEKNGFAYKTQTGLVFDTGKFKDYDKFGKLSLEEQEAGARVDVDKEKKEPWDFLLWVTNQPQHVMQWDSPWGRGFPGWHIECTAMSTKYLGENFDIHTGGKEHIPVHHTNEIAQAYGAFGRQTANFWLHNDWVMINNEKISKSLGNGILVSQIQEKGYNPLALRYLILTSHYKQGLNFTWESLGVAQASLNKLYDIVNELKNSKDKRKTFKDGSVKWEEKFVEALENDLGLPQAMAVVWEMLKSTIPDKDKYKMLLEWDGFLGLKLKEAAKKKDIPKEVMKLVQEREAARKQKDFKKSDALREKIKQLGYAVEDGDKPKIKKI
jgi:cysteinyl-tRNA synthetase